MNSEQAHFTVRKKTNIKASYLSSSITSLFHETTEAYYVLLTLAKLHVTIKRINPEKQDTDYNFTDDA